MPRSHPKTSETSYKKVVLVPGYGCNNRCVFCINSGKRDIKPKSAFELRLEIKAAVERGCDYLEFAGGENTINPDFCGLVRYARKAGFKRVAIATNGRLFSYPDFAKAAVDSGLSEIIFSIHGPDAAVHDGLTRVKGSFSQLRRGIDNVRRIFKGIVATNTAVTRLNYRSLPATGRFIAGLGLFNAEFIFADPTYGGVSDNFKELMPRISECAPYMRACLDIAAPRLAGAADPLAACNWSARYVPLCYFRDYYPLQVSEARERLIYRNVQHVAPDYVNLDYIKGRREIGRAKAAKCRGCALAGPCEGIWKEYLRIYGDAELKPLKKAGPARGKGGGKSNIIDGARPL